MAVTRRYIEDNVLRELKKYEGGPEGVSRKTLVAMTGYSDRAIRDAIEVLIDRGEPIGHGRKRGYTYGNYEGMAKIRKDCARRVNNLSRKLTRIDRTMQLEGQEAMDEILVPVL